MTTATGCGSDSDAPTMNGSQTLPPSASQPSSGDTTTPPAPTSAASAPASGEQEPAAPLSPSGTPSPVASEAPAAPSSPTPPSPASTPAPGEPTSDGTTPPGPTASSSVPAAGSTPPPEGSSPGTTPTAPLPDTPTPVAPGPDLSAAELIASCDLGWNLGNSLDVPEGETAWGNPVVTPELLQAVADAGFDLVRIPVTWSMQTGPGPEYTIDPARLARVEEVVNYVLDAGMYAIINLHHDGADDYDGVEWITLTDDAGNISDTTNAAVEERFGKVWTQLAAHFGKFDSRLLFESMNEIHDGYDAPDPGYYPIINHLNQVFVDTIRGSGGNNASRHLVVPGYNTNIDYTLEGFARPEDPTADKLILSVHFYDPWSFAGEGASPAWGAGQPGADSWGQEDFVVTQFDRLKAAYVDQGLPMIIGEYGAVNQSGAENYRRYYMEYVTQAACQRGILPVYWDNGGIGSGPDKFALVDRTTFDVVHPDILDAMIRGCSSTEPLEAIAAP